MADRVFAGAILVIALLYTYIAFTVIKAPFQYDPLGPESWPKLLGIVASLCAIYLIARPDVARLKADLGTLGRLALVVVMLLAYGRLFEPLGFLVSTWVFCTAFGIMLGATPLKAFAFGAVTGTVGYFACTRLLELNLPAGLLNHIL
ncbi:tripartite tricarboxylate transporter TctB family protein [Stappia indica]|uniref:tripartite tricarboxylate transporter TctB family protein n=1 Tax=Stappia indica TaxID=538381 RepID=UPI00082B877F|nr:tripartite tricarboxylate transporter TctB family protein [Stappia indica]